MHHYSRINISPSKDEESDQADDASDVTPFAARLRTAISTRIPSSSLIYKGSNGNNMIGVRVELAIDNSGYKAPRVSVAYM